MSRSSFRCAAFYSPTPQSQNKKSKLFLYFIACSFSNLWYKKKWNRKSDSISPKFFPLKKQAAYTACFLQNRQRALSHLPCAPSQRFLISLQIPVFSDLLKSLLRCPVLDVPLRSTKKASCLHSLLFTKTGNVLFSRAVSRQVSSALKSLTSVFEMGTGGSSSPLSPDEALARFILDKSLAGLMQEFPESLILWNSLRIPYSLPL